MGYLNPINGPVITAGGTIDVVTTDVPLPFRDIAFWPCVAGEDFPPAFGGSGGPGASYQATHGLPVVRIVVGGGTGPVAAWPYLPRVSFAGKDSLELSGKMIPYFAGSVGATSSFGINADQSSTSRQGRFNIVARGPGVGYNFTYSDGVNPPVTVANVIPAEVVGIVHTWALALTSAGAIIATIDGVQVVTTPNGIWPTTADDTPQLRAWQGALEVGFNLAALQAVWS